MAAAMRKIHSGSRNRNRRNNNRRYTNNGNSRSAANSNNQLNILPSPSILQEYEYATEGAADRILEMAEVEQDRRHEWEDDYLLYYKKSLRIGQLFGFLLLISILAACVYLASNGSETVAVYLALIGFFSVAFANFFSAIGKKKHSRRPGRQKK